MRDKEQDLNCLTSSGLPKPLGCISRLPKQNTTGIIPDDGFVRNYDDLLFLERIGDFKADIAVESDRPQSAGKASNAND